MIHFLNLVRWKNLVLIALSQILVKYALLVPFYESHGVVTALSELAFFLLVFSTLCIAGAGYIINDVCDVETDTINRPNTVIIGNFISEKTANSLFVVLNVIGVGIGFYLSNGIGKSGFFVLFFMASALLYIYSTYFKKVPLAGNIIVSFVVALSILIIGIFEVLPVMTETNRNIQITFFKIITDYAIFAFLINFLREIVKDIEDIDGDFKAGMNTLPIAIGRERTSKIAFALSFLPLFAVIYYLATYLFRQIEAIVYFLILVVGPLIYISIKLFSADQKSHYTHLSNLLKIIMLTGLLSMILYPYILK